MLNRAKQFNRTLQPIVETVRRRSLYTGANYTTPDMEHVSYGHGDRTVQVPRYVRDYNQRLDERLDIAKQRRLS